MKTCPTCCIEKPISDFNVNKSKKDGLQTFCRECQRDYDRNYYAVRESRRSTTYARVKKHRADKRQLVWNYLKHHPCADCGEKDPLVLEFDHSDPETKTAEISRMIQAGASVERIFNEIAKCEVRCANCHRRRTALQFDWYKDLNT